MTNILVGKHNLSDKDEIFAVKHKIKEIIVHPLWLSNNKSKFDADIALLALDKQVDLIKNRVQLVCLPIPTDKDPTGDGFVVSWGKSEKSDEPLDPTPNELQLPAVDVKTCFNFCPTLANLASLRTFCAGFKSQKKSVCLGDSGSGYFQLENNLYLVSELFPQLIIVRQAIVTRIVIHFLRMLGVSQNGSWKSQKTALNIKKSNSTVQKLTTSLIIRVFTT